MSQPIGINEINQLIDKYVFDAAQQQIHNHFIDVVLKHGPLQDRNPQQEWVDDIDRIIDGLINGEAW